MLQKLIEFPLADIILDEYQHLCGRALIKSTNYPLPYIGEIIQETWETKDIEIQESAVQEAVFRKDYEIFGMDKRDFIREALTGNLHGFEIPTLHVTEVAHEVFLFLRDRHISFIDYDGFIVNAPFGSEIW